MANFWLGFGAKNPVKSDKLALIEGKILNLMFLDIYIPVVPIENWIRLTHNQRQKTLKFASVLLFIPPYFKDQIVARMQLLPVKFPDMTGHSTRRANDRSLIRIVQ